MTAEQAWKELAEKFGHLDYDGKKLLYFWEPDESTPVSSNQRAGSSWDDTKLQEDIAEAYAVVLVPGAPGTVVVYAKWPVRGWDANPWNERHLIRHLVDRVAPLEKVAEEAGEVVASMDISMMHRRNGQFQESLKIDAEIWNKEVPRLVHALTAAGVEGWEKPALDSKDGDGEEG